MLGISVLGKRVLMLRVFLSAKCVTYRCWIYSNSSWLDSTKLATLLSLACWENCKCLGLGLLGSQEFSRTSILSGLPDRVPLFIPKLCQELIRCSVMSPLLQRCFAAEKKLPTAPNCHFIVVIWNEESSFCFNCFKMVPSAMSENTCYVGFFSRGVSGICMWPLLICHR